MQVIPAQRKLDTLSENQIKTVKYLEKQCNISQFKAIIALNFIDYTSAT
jgi:hypothetical protein